MALAIPTRTKTLNTLETLVIATAGGGLFLWAQLPGGLITGAMIAVGVANPSAQGHATISTATAFTTATPAGARYSQTPNVTTAIASTATVK